MRRAAGAGALVWCALLLGACGDHEGVQVPSAAAPARPGGVVEVGSSAWQALPAAERVERIRLLQSTAGVEFNLAQRAPGSWVAEHGAAGLRASFERGRVSVVPASAAGASAEPLDLAAAAWGCVGELQPVDPGLPASDADRPTEAHYVHGGFDEWYANGPAGLEQGFTIRALPECAKQRGKLRIRLRFADNDGALAQVTPSGDEAVLTTPGHQALHYSDAFAQDAAGQQHTVRITGGDELALEVDVSGAALPLLVDPLVWVERQLVVTADGAPGDAVGRAVAIFGDTALVGAPGDDDKGTDSGSAYLYKRVAATTPGLPAFWGSPQKLVANDGASGDGFGSAVALSAGFALVGAPADDDKGADSGSAYVFALNGSVWSQQQKLVPSDLQANDQFGSSVLISGATAVIGAPFQSASSLGGVGAAYAFDRAVSTWTQQRKFVVPASETAADLHFGAGLALFGDTLAIGRNSLGAGGVNWFTRTGSTWSASSSEVLSTIPHFGSALAMTATTTFIGAYGDTTKGVDAGSVSITSNATPHTALTTLTATDGAANARFGFALSAEAGTLIVAAPAAVIACKVLPCKTAGIVYAFTSSASTWTLQQALTSTLELSGDSFGNSVAFAGRTALIGAPLHAVTAGKTGVMWSYEVGLNNASACTQNSDCATSFCIEGVCCESPCDGACRSCLASLKDPKTDFQSDSKDGRCGKIKVNTDPKNGCFNMGTACGTTDNCGAQGLCASPPTTTPCGDIAATCPTPTSESSHNACINLMCSPFAVDCGAGYLCKAGACKTSCVSNDDCDASKGFSCISGSCKLGSGAACKNDSDCETGACGFGYCCVPVAIYGCSTPPGELCDTNDECFSHHCVDGVCCDTACDGACQACGLPGSQGICSPVTNDPQDPPGLCAPIVGSDGGEGGDGGAPQGGNDPVTTGGSGGTAQAGGGGAFAMGGSVSSQGGSVSSQGGASNGGAGGGHTQAGEAGAKDSAGEAGAGSPAADADQRVTACGCRAVGGRGAGGSALSLLGLVALAALSSRRKRSF